MIAIEVIFEYHLTAAKCTPDATKGQKGDPICLKPSVEDRTLMVSFPELRCLSSLVTHLFRVSIKSEFTLLIVSALTYVPIFTTILFMGKTLGCTRKNLISNLEQINHE